MALGWSATDEEPLSKQVVIKIMLNVAPGCLGAKKFRGISTHQDRKISVDYEIRVPRDSRLEIHHGTGQVLLANITGDIEATGHRGDILLMLLIRPHTPSMRKVKSAS